MIVYPLSYFGRTYLVALSNTQLAHSLQNVSSLVFPLAYLSITTRPPCHVCLMLVDLGLIDLGMMIAVTPVICEIQRKGVERDMKKVTIALHTWEAFIE